MSRALGRPSAGNQRLIMHPRAFVRDSLGTALSQYMVRVVLLLRGVVAAAALGPLGYGAWNALSLLLDYGSYATCGALQGLDLRLPAAAARGDRVQATRLMSAAWSVTAIGFVVVGSLVWLLWLRGGGPLATPWGWGATALMLVAVWFQLAIQYHAGALRAHGDFQVVSGGLAAQAVLGGGLGMATVSRLGVWGLLVGWLIGSLVALLWMRRGAVRPPLLGGALGEGFSLARLGISVFAFFLVSLVLRSVDRIALVHYAGPVTLGYYSIGLMAAGLILYLPEAVATVLYPRLSAAAQGARDPDRTRLEFQRTHRALAVALPPLVALGMVWAGPVVSWLLPAFREGVPALRFLSLGALVLSGATLPGYFVLASGSRSRLLAITSGVAALTALLVFGVASRDPRATSVALAAAAGYTAFAVTLVALAAGVLGVGVGGTARLLGTAFVPALWAGSASLAACALGRSESVAAAALRSVGVLAAYVPVVWWLGQGVGLRRLAQEWLSGRLSTSES